MSRPVVLDHTSRSSILDTRSLPHERFPPADRRLLGCSCLATTVAPAQERDRATRQRRPGPFLVKPYLQLGHAPAPGALQLLWHAADADADWSVEYPIGRRPPVAKADEPPTSRRVAVAGIEPHRVYRAALTGLEPGGIFDYGVSKGGEVVFSAEGRALKSADQPHRFVAFGDCGAGTPEQKPLAYGRSWPSPTS